METKLIITPSELSSIATAMRGRINIILAYARTGDSKHIEQELEGLRRDSVSFKLKAREMCKQNNVD